MIKKYNKFINEQKFNSKYDSYVYYTKGVGLDEMKQIYQILFDNGFTCGNKTDVNLLSENQLNNVFLFIDDIDKSILNSSLSAVPNDKDVIDEFLRGLGYERSFYLFKDFVDFKKIFSDINIKNYIKPSKLVYERACALNDESIDSYVYYSQYDDITTMKKVYQLLFDNGFKMGSNTDVDELNARELVCTFLLINLYSKQILHANNNSVINNRNLIDDFLISHGLYKNFYLFKDFNDLKNVLNPVRIENYTKPTKLVYESVLDHLKGPTEKERDEYIKFNRLKTNKVHFLKMISDGDESLAIKTFHNNPITFFSTLKEYNEDFLKKILNKLLYESVTSKYFIITTVLIDYGADVNYDGVPEEVCDINNYILFKKCIDNGMKLNNECLINSVWVGNVAIVKAIVESGEVDVNYDNGKPLIVAFKQNFYGVANYLVSVGAKAIISNHIVNYLERHNSTDLLNLYKKLTNNDKEI